MIKTKYFLPLLAFTLLFAACQAPVEEWPQDLAGKKELLKTKRTELKEVKKLVEQLETEIEALEPTQEKPRKLVTTAPVNRKDFERFVEIQGSVQSDDLVMATSETGGRLLSVSGKEGQRVAKGQLLATVDLETVNKQIAEVEKGLELAIEVYERQDRLWKQNIGSEMQLLQAKNNKERLEKSLETLRHQLTRGNVYAPIGGVIDQVFLKAGELAGPGTPIMQILNTSKVKVVANVPEIYLKSVRKGQMVNIKIPALEEDRKGRISLLGTSINPDNRTFNVEVEMPNRGGLLKPNLLANMYISDYKEKDVVLIPLETVQQEIGGKSYVFISSNGNAEGVAQKVYVETGESYDNEIIITTGLKGGETLILEGARGLTENELITVENNTTENNG